MRYFIGFLVLVVLGCGSSKKGNNVGGTTGCTVVGTMKNYSEAGMDGCDFVIVDERGNKYQPVNNTSGKDLEHNVRVRFGYRELKDVMTTCMMGVPVELTCLEVLSKVATVTDGASVGDPCSAPPTDPNLVDWMRVVIERSKADEVWLYSYEGRLAYFFKVTKCCDFQSYLHACDGTRLCTDGGITGGNCVQLEKKMKKDRVIWSRVSDK